MIFDTDDRSEHLLKRGRGGETGQYKVLGEVDCSGIYNGRLTIWTWAYIITTTIITIIMRKSKAHLSASCSCVFLLTTSRACATFYQRLGVLQFK